MSSTRAPLAIVVAVAEGGVIGSEGGLPWHLPEDLRHFKAVTMGHAIIMGRKTFDSIGRALPGRTSIVVSRGLPTLPEGVLLAKTLDEAIAMARREDKEPRIIGGASIYEAALPLATRIYLTEVDRRVAGDTYFPAFDRAEFREIERRPGTTQGVSFVTLAR